MKFQYGGQALIEGVMMKGRKNLAMAVRRGDGTIGCEIEAVESIADKYPILKKPFIRGSVNLVESMVMGFKALTYSANESAESEEEELTKGEMIFSIVIAMALGVGLFFVGPAVLAHLMSGFITGPVMQNIVEGVIRILVFILYVLAISRMKDIQRVFQYHGAEHKVIHAYESDIELTPANCKKYTTLHPRCGTSFMLIVMVISIAVFSVIGVENVWWRIISRIILLPVVAGVSYEFLKYSSRHMDNPIIKALSYPGIMMQKLTTREPDEEQLEVAIAALNKVMDIEEGHAIRNM